MLVNRRSLRVEWGDCDPAGIVFYPNYLIWFDASTTRLFERTGMSLPELYKKHGSIGMPLVEIGVKFLVSSRFGDELLVESGVTEWGRSSLTVQHRFLKAGRLALEGFEKRVWSVPHPDQPGRIKSQAVPAEIISALSKPDS